MAKRIGAGKGKGKGYKNLPNYPKDPKVHSDSAKGRKQPQRVSPSVDAILGQKSFEFTDLKTEEIPEGKKESALSRTARKSGRFIKEKAIQSEQKVKTELQKRKEKRQAQRIKELEEVNHPLVKELQAQKERVDELKTQISEAENSRQEEKLFSELEKEQEQLRQAQEKVTQLKTEDLSDQELKTLAIRWKDDSLFGSTNPYVKELKRRIKAEKDIEKELDEERKKDTGFSIF